MAVETCGVEQRTHCCAVLCSRDAAADARDQKVGDRFLKSFQISVLVHGNGVDNYRESMSGP